VTCSSLNQIIPAPVANLVNKASHAKFQMIRASFKPV
jgi:hypothetical protein